MGKVLFSIVLVAAAFAGGAAINGPGLRWVQAKVGLLTAGDGDADPEKDQDPAAAGPHAGIPATPLPALVIEPPQPDFKDKDQEKDKNKPKPDPAPAPSQAPGVASTPPPDASAPVPEPKAPAPLDPRDLFLKLGDEPPGAKPRDDAPPPRLEPPAANDTDGAKGAAAETPALPWSDMPGSAPAAAVPPRPQPRAADADPAVARAHLDLEPTPPASGVTTAPATRTAGDWAELRRQMRALGVARYGIEGEPGGRVRFHCLIPLAGRRAVGQQFEAEGDDEIQAAQAALRRVALWRATEGEPAASSPAPARPAD